MMIMPVRTPMYDMTTYEKSYRVRISYQYIIVLTAIHKDISTYI